MRRNEITEQKIRDAEDAMLWFSPSNRTEYSLARRRLSAGKMREPYPGLYGREETCRKLDPRATAYRTLNTLIRDHPTWRYCQFSAALLHGIHVPYSKLKPVHIVVEPTQNCSHTKALRRHACRADIVPIDGALATSIDQTVMDCLCRTSLSEGLGIVDSALHWNLTSMSQLEAYFAEHGTGLRGIEQARSTLSYADERSENGGESALRAIVITAGFALPELQVEIQDPLGSDSYVRVDFYWTLPDGSTVICEFDGAQKYLESPSAADNPEQALKNAVKKMSDERARESLINLTGAVVVRITSRHLANPAFIITLLERAGVPRHRHP